MESITHCVRVPEASLDSSRVYFASSESDFLKVKKIWKKVYSEELGWLDSEKADPREDLFHANSKYALAVNGEGEPIGVMRLVHNSRIGLPIEQFIDIKEFKEDSNGSLIECARLMVPQEYRDMKFDGMPYGAYAALVKITLHYCLHRKIYHVLANCFLDTQTTPIKSLKMFGFKDIGIRFRDELSEASECTALLLDIKDMLSIFYSPRNSIGRYMMASEGGVIVHGEQNNG